MDLLNKQSFSEQVEVTVRYGRGVTYLDAIVHVCEKNEIEIEVGAKLINDVVKKRLEAEASELNFLKDVSPRLPI